MPKEQSLGIIKYIYKRVDYDSVFKVTVDLKSIFKVNVGYVFMTSTQLSGLLLYTTCPIYNLSHNLLACSVSPQSRNAWRIAIILIFGLGEGVLNWFL